MIRVAATLSVLSATTDEPVHVTAGIELLLRRTYDVLPENPPLARVLFAAPIVAAGADFDPQHEAKHYIGRTFYARGHYRTNLVLARVGNLLFFLLAALAVWRIARRELGENGGLVATLLFTTQPMILGFAGIANHDMPATAGTALALLAFSRWLERRTIARAFVVGLAYGLAIGLKFSSIPFVPVACIALFLVKAPRQWRAALFAVPPIIAGAVLALGCTYIGTPSPYATFLRGLTSLFTMARGGFDGYALGRWSNQGWWWYFPLALALKTTLGSLLLAFGWWLARDRRTYLAWLAAALAILLVAMPSKFDLGVRYVLPIYVPLTIAMAAVAISIRRIAAIVLLAWHCVASLVAHPQYFAYFNELAIGDRSQYLIDSNLDWGQDALLLERVLREKKVDAIGLNLVGMHDYRFMGYPTTYPVDPHIPATGWIAVSDHEYRRHLRRGGWRWLRGRPYERVGAAVRLYYVPHV